MEKDSNEQQDDDQDKPTYLFDVHSPSGNVNLGNVTNATLASLSPWQRRVVDLLTKATVATTIAGYAIAEIARELTKKDDKT